MCGLFGAITSYVNGFSNDESKSFFQGLFVDQLRGDDATGICLVENDTQATVKKKSVSADLFLLDKEITDLRNVAISRGAALLGHNRKTTIGGNDDQHAHPFLVNNDKVFFHNGTLYNHKKLKDTTVDSEALGHHITDYKDIKDLENRLSEVSGAYATVWYDQKEHSVKFLRNHQRPLSYAIAKNGSVFYASERSMLYFILGRNNIAIDKTDDFKTDTLYTLSLDDVRKGFNETEMKIPSFTQATSHTTGKKSGTTIMPAVTTANQVSKNQFKRISRMLANIQSASFFVDFAEEDNVGNMLVLGENDDFPGVIFKGTLINKHAIQYSEDYLRHKLMAGRIAYVTYDRNIRKCVAHMSELKVNTYKYTH